MKVAVVNDARSQIPGSKTLWDDLVEWLGGEFVGDVPFPALAEKAAAYSCDVLIRNGSFFGPIQTEAKQVSLIQDIFTEGPAREMQEAVIRSSTMTVFNSAFTAGKYLTIDFPSHHMTIPLPVDFTVFEPGNSMGLQQALSLPDGCVCWIGACREAGYVKGWDIFIQVARLNPDLHFVAVLKDAMPDSFPPNVRCYVRVAHEDLVKIIGACRVGLCTSRMESQHLAGIEMGACGLPLVVPPVGAYYLRGDIPGVVYGDVTPSQIAGFLRMALNHPSDPVQIRPYWQREFDKPVIREAWTKLVEEVECQPK